MRSVCPCMCVHMCASTHGQTRVPSARGCVCPCVATREHVRVPCVCPGSLLSFLCPCTRLPGLPHGAPLGRACVRAKLLLAPCTFTGSHSRPQPTFWSALPLPRSWASGQSSPACLGHLVETEQLSVSCGAHTSRQAGLQPALHTRARPVCARVSGAL